MAENKMSDIIRSAIDGIKTSFDANTVTGKPVSTANGTVIIPVSKVSAGFATGGLDYLGKNRKEIKSNDNNFAGGGGTGVTVTPVAFLVINPDGDVKVLNISEKSEPQDPVSQIINAIERSPELIEKLKEVFKKKDKEDAE